MERDEKLALAVRAEAACIRAEQARERAALLEKRVQPLTDAMAKASSLLGHEITLENPEEARLVGQLLHGKPAVDWDDLKAAIASLTDVMTLEKEASDAMHEIARQWGNRDGATIGDWVGCTEDEYAEALDRELSVAT